MPPLTVDIHRPRLVDMTNSEHPAVTLSRKISALECWIKAAGEKGVSERRVNKAWKELFALEDQRKALCGGWA